MRLGLIAAPLVLVSAIATPTAASPDQADIIGGERTTPGEFLTVVVITVGNALCTGTLIHPEWVVTAAHCVSPGTLGATQAQITSATQVHFDTLDLSRDTGSVVRASETIPRLPNWNDSNIGANDIGLIRLRSPVTSRPPSAINLDRARAPVGTVVTMVGYGATLPGTPPGGTVGVQFELVDRTSQSCGPFGESDALLLCFSQTDNKGKCAGDSGGPSFAMIDGVETVVGVTSFGDEACTELGADTRTDAEAAFLLEKIPQLERCATVDDCDPGEVCENTRCFADPLADNGLGAFCETSDDCLNGQCAAGPDGTRCSDVCTVGLPGDCPDGFECLRAGVGGACWPEGAGDGGCCDASGRGGPTALLGFALVGLIWRRRRGLAAPSSRSRPGMTTKQGEGTQANT